MNDRMLYAAVAGFISGVFLHSFVEAGRMFSLFFVLLGVVLFVLFSLNKGSTGIVVDGRRGRDVTTPALADSGTPFVKGDLPRSFLIISVFLLSAGLGMLRYDVAERDSVKSGLESYVSRTAVFEGIISDEPDVREASTHLVIEVVEESTSRILLIAPHEPRFAYGDRVTVSGKLEHPKNFVDEVSGREVDYKAYLAKDGIYYSMLRPKLTLLSHRNGNPIIEKLLAFKHAFIENIHALIPQPHSALLGGLVVGAKQSLGKELLDDFRTVGVIHVVVLSGYNITIIAVFIEWLLSRLRKNLRLALAALAMILFALMVGASATVIRATVMALLALLARGTARMYQVTRALLVAGVIMLLHNPKILVFDVSFQLSFLATLGLIYISPLVEPKVKWVTERWNIRAIVVATVSTQAFVLPFLLYKTGIFSIVSLPVNLLILTAIPATMLFGFLAGMTAFLSGTLALPFAYVAYALLAYELGVVEWFANLPFAAVTLAYFPLWLVLLWYAAYAILYFVWRKKQSTVVSHQGLLS